MEWYWIVLISYIIIGFVFAVLVLTYSMDKEDLKEFLMPTGVVLCLIFLYPYWSFAYIIKLFIKEKANE